VSALPFSALELAIPLDPIDPSQVRSGEPRAGFVAVDTRDGLELGIWEITPGVSTDVEADEWSVVVSGRATVAFDDGRASMELAAASVFRLDAGDRTTWTVHETLRKVYITPVTGTAE
jgi:uncharacterized cupin superfamily protein